MEFDNPFKSLKVNSFDIYDVKKVLPYTEFRLSTAKRFVSEDILKRLQELIEYSSSLYQLKLSELSELVTLNDEQSDRILSEIDELNKLIATFQPDKLPSNNSNNSNDEDGDGEPNSSETQIDVSQYISDNPVDVPSSYTRIDNTNIYYKIDTNDGGIPVVTVNNARVISAIGNPTTNNPRLTIINNTGEQIYVNVFNQRMIPLDSRLQPIQSSYSNFLFERTGNEEFIDFMGGITIPAEIHTISINLISNTTTFTLVNNGVELDENEKVRIYNGNFDLRFTLYTNQINSYSYENQYIFEEDTQQQLIINE